MRILMHVCCGPCAIYPLEALRDEGVEVGGYFFNPNIHPYREFKRRIGALEELAAALDFQVEIEREYGLIEYLRQVVRHEHERCPICYDMRLSQAAKRAAEQGMDGFTTTLLYSRYQNHELIRERGEHFAQRYGIGFVYRDFRKGWQHGIDRSLALGLYRQPYCGCIYSEQERYDKKWRKRQRQKARAGVARNISKEHGGGK